MILSPPIPWSAVPDNAIAMLDGNPCRIMSVVPTTWPGGVIVYPECSALRYFTTADTTRIVQLDEADAIGALFAAGLNPQIIEGEQP